jgi:alpha-L-rhamnosidase
MHVMYGDILACLYRHFAGIIPDEEHPGFARTFFRPRCPSALDLVRAYHDSPCGRIASEWRRTNEGIAFRVTVPDGAAGSFEYGDIRAELGPGTHEFACRS